MSHRCYSSWQKRNDISSQAIFTGAPEYNNFSISFINDGFYCQYYGGFGYHSTPFSNEGGWVQADLRAPRTLLCLKVPVRSSKVYRTANFDELEIRFGNKSREDDFSKNLVIISRTAHGLEGKIFEYCLDRPLVGRYLLIQEKRSSDDSIYIGEIQIIVN